MNFYSDEIFSQALEAAYFPDRKIEPRLFELNGKLWKIPTINSTEPIIKFPFQSTFIDFYEPYEQESTHLSHQVQKLAYIPKAFHGLVSSDEWFEQKLDQNYEPAPTIIWNNFASWDDFTKYVRQKNGSKFFSDTRRRHRKLEQELGPLTFVLDDRRTDVLATCMYWKSNQYLRSGLIDAFAYKEHVKLFQELANRSLLLVSSLYANEKLIAAHIGVLSKERLYSWIPAYDNSYAASAPGRLLLLFILEESFKHNHEEFDFLIGNESYKWSYATHTRLIAEMGVPPIPVQMNRSMKAVIKPIVSSSLKPFPGLKKSWDNVRHQLRTKLYELKK